MANAAWTDGRESGTGQDTPKVCVHVPPRRPRAKGDRTERTIVNALKASIAAVRVPLSGAVGGRFAGDIVLPLLGRDLCVEVKARADGFRELYCWLNQRDVLIVKADRQEPLVVVRLSFATEIAKLAAPTRCFATALKDVVGKGDGEKGDMT